MENPWFAKSLFLALTTCFFFARGVEAKIDKNYFRQGFGQFFSNDDWGRTPEMDIQFELSRFKKISTIFKHEYYFPFSQAKDHPAYVFSHSRLRLKYELAKELQPYATLRYDDIRGEELPFHVWGYGGGVGIESEWEFSNKFFLVFRVEAGGLRFNNSDNAYVDTELSASYLLWHWADHVDIYLRAEGETKSLVGGNENENLVKGGPGIGFRFTNDVEVGLYSEVIYNDSHRLRNSTDKISSLIGLEYRAALHPNENRKLSWAPAFNLNILGAANGYLLMNHIHSEIIPQLFRRDRWRLQFIIWAGFSRYIRKDDQSTSHYELDVGPRLAWIAGDATDETLAWTLDARAYHRSEHVSNPPTAVGTDGPETAYIEIGSPGFAYDRLQRGWGWMDLVQGAIRYQTFLFADAERNPEWAEEDFIIRLSLRLWLIEFQKGQFYVQGQRSFFGEDPIRWKGEVGWQRLNWFLFFRSESINMSHPNFSDRIEHFFGIKFLFMN